MADSQPLSGAPEGAEYLRAVLRAPVYEAAQVTPLQKMEKLSSRLDNVILVKREDRQPVHSFKLRGAYAMMAGLTEEQKAHGVITASAGNHAQGVAFSSARLGVKALIVMPTATADIKVDAVRGFGGEVLLHGANFDEAKAKAIELSQQQGFTWVPPFDHPMVIAGQGTLALELLQQDAHLDRVFVPVGGGGLAAGVAVLIKQLMPQIKVIAVEAEDSACPFVPTVSLISNDVIGILYFFAISNAYLYTPVYPSSKVTKKLHFGIAFFPFLYATRSS